MKNKIVRQKKIKAYTKKTKNNIFKKKIILTCN